MAYANPADQRAFQLKWIQGRRTAWLDGNGPCLRCGSTENLRPYSDRVEIPHNIWSWARERQLPILQQCIALCASCHRRESLKKRALKAQTTVKNNSSTKVTSTPEVEVMSVPSAAKFLGIGKSTAYELIRNGKIPAFRISEGTELKVRKYDLDALLLGEVPPTILKQPTNGQQSVVVDPSSISVEGKEVVITVTIKVV